MLVDPAIPKVVNLIAFEVFGDDLTIAFSAEADQLQINAFGPIISERLFNGFKHFTDGYLTLANLCVARITANPERLRESLDRSSAPATVLNLLIGYKKSTEITSEARRSNSTIRETVLRQDLLSKVELDEALRPEKLLQPCA